LQTTDELHQGMEIIAGTEAIGELLEVLDRDDVKYLHVRRFGSGMDDLYIPSIAISRLAPKHIYLAVAAEDLLGQAWRVVPSR
jgi:hypothetical protein